MRLTRIPKSFIGLIILMIGTFCHALALDLNDPIPVGPQVNKGQLANGLTYYVQRNEKPARKTELRLVIKAGSAMEDDDQKGLAHVLEHMAFNGSTNFKKHELISYLQAMGLKFGADLNAYTSFNETVYILPLPTTKPEELAMGMQVLEDWAHGLTLNTKDIDAERSIVLEELRLGKGVQDRITRQILPKLFQGSKYADRLPIGNEQDLKTFNPDALRRFYHDWYRPNRMAVVAVGDFDTAAMESLIKKHFEPLVNPTPERAATVIDVPKNQELDALVVTDPENSSETMQIVYPVIPSLDAIRLKDYREDAVELLFNSLLEQRLALETQQATPPFISGGARFQKTMPGYKAFTMSADINREGLASAVDALVQGTENARLNGFTLNELNRVKKNYWSSLQLAYSEKDKTESNIYASEYIRNFLVNESIPGIVEELRINKEMLNTITLEEMNAFAKKVLPLKSDPALILYTGSEKSAKTPTSPELKSLFVEAFSKPLRAQVTIAQDESVLLSTIAPPGTILHVDHHESMNVDEYTLSNGLRVLVKPTMFKDGQILLSASRFGGQSLYPTSDRFNAAYATTIANAMGLGKNTPTALSNILAGKLATLNVAMSMYSESVSGQASPENADTMFELMHLRFAPMRRDNALFSAFISRSQDATANTSVRPEVEFLNELTKVVYQNNPRASLTPTPDDFSNIVLTRVENIYNERFKSASGFDFILVGNIEPTVLKEWLEKYFASLPTGDIKTMYHDVDLRTLPEPAAFEIKKGSEAKSVVTMVFAGLAPVSDSEQLRLHIMTEVMNLRIIEVLREQKQLIYSGGLSGAMSYTPLDQFFIRADLPCAPDNVEALVSAMENEIRILQRDGPTKTDMAKVMTNWFSVQSKQEQDNEYWIAQLQNRTLYKKPIESSLAWSSLAQTITPADIQEAAKRYLPLHSYIKAVLAPALAHSKN